MIAELVLVLTLAGALVLVAWLVHGREAAVDQAADARVSQAGVQGELERARFEIEVGKKALESAQSRAAALEEAIADEISKNPNADLDRSNIRDRVLRFSQRWAQADRNRVPAVGSQAMPDAGAAAAPGAPAVPAKPSGVP